MQETVHTIRELKAEVDRLRAFVSDIHTLSAELVDGEGKENHHVAGKIRAEIERLRRLVFTDELTGLLNRRGLKEHFERLFREALFARAHPKQQRSMTVPDMALIYIDLDDFKRINDTLGHDEGDRVLKETARVLERHVRDIDGAVRLGGEEFLVVLVGAEEGQAYAKAETIRASLTHDVVVSAEKEWPLTASVGVASLGASDADDFDELVGYADKAMYEAKSNRGKNTVVRYSELGA